MNKYKKGILAALLVAAIAGASTIKVWTSGEYITSTSLNANFAHIHNTMVGGHGPRLVDADVSGSASLSHSKLATPALLPKLWVHVSYCITNPCTIADSSGVSGVTRYDAGIYTVTYTTARPSVNYGPMVSTRGPTPAQCMSGIPAAGSSTVTCHTLDGGYFVDSAFTYLLMDSEN